MTVLKWTNRTYFVLVSTVALLGFLALHDALPRAGDALLLTLFFLVLPATGLVLLVMQLVPLEFWQVLLLGAVAVYVWIYACALLVWLVVRDTRRPDDEWRWIRRAE